MIVALSIPPWMFPVRRRDTRRLPRKRLKRIRKLGLDFSPDAWLNPLPRGHPFYSKISACIPPIMRFADGATMDLLIGGGLFSRILDGPRFVEGKDMAKFRNRIRGPNYYEPVTRTWVRNTH